MKAILISFFLSGLFCSITVYSQSQPSEPIVSTSFYVPSESILHYKLGDIQIPIKVLQYGERTDLICVNVHDNERTSVEAAKTILQVTGGTLVSIDNRKQRVIRFRFKGLQYSFDPNRMFSDEGIIQTLKENCGRTSEGAMSEIRGFAGFILDLIPETASCIIALHNNTNEAFSIKTYLPGNDREKDAKEVKHQESQDPDDIILTTDETLFRKMAEFGYNAIWQDSEHAKRDGSLSIWSAENQRRYINIETQHGRLQQYVEMMQRLMEYLETEAE